MEFTLQVTDQEIMIIGNALGKQPYDVVATLVSKLQQQVNAQQEEKAKKDEQSN